MTTPLTLNDEQDGGFDCNAWFANGDQAREYAESIPTSLIDQMREILDRIRQTPSAIGESIPVLKVLINSHPTLVSLYARANVALLGLMIVPAIS
ncbi:MAG: hypothetical protein WCT46_03440 [Candidatus Gracilibacteria bacterium]|jgi:hypothetical protein